MHQLILASGSPQRSVLLGGLIADFLVVPSSVDEAACGECDPVARAVLLAKLKAEDVRKNHPHAVIIGCDTLVVSSEGVLLEKPRDSAEAECMMRMHSGSVSSVHSALCILDSTGNAHEGVSSSTVRFANLTEEQISWWINTGLWRDRSGGFQIDGLGQMMIENIEGDWTSIVGLPVFLLSRLLFKAGIDLCSLTKSAI